MSTRHTKKRVSDDPPENKDPKKNRQSTESSTTTSTVSPDDQGGNEKPPASTVDNDKEDERLITNVDRPGLTAELYDRLNLLNNHASERVACASLAKVDLTALEWGAPAPSRRDRSRYLCKNNNIFNLWSVAEVIAVSIWERDGNGRRFHPRDRQSILFRPLLDADFEVARHIVTHLAQPVAELDDADGLWTGRYMSEWGKPAHATPIMDKVYDARERFESKQAMPSYSIEDINGGDIVLLEMVVVRYRKKNKNEATTSSSVASTSSAPPSPQTSSSPSKERWQKKPWIEWDIDLRLEACSLLYADPDGKGPRIEEDEFRA